MDELVWGNGAARPLYICVHVVMYNELCRGPDGRRERGGGVGRQLLSLLEAMWIFGNKIEEIVVMMAVWIMAVFHKKKREGDPSA